MRPWVAQRDHWEQCELDLSAKSLGFYIQNVGRLAEFTAVSRVLGFRVLRRGLGAP